MLEVDEDSRLGRELIAGGQKYHAHFVPDEDLTADMYEIACDRLNAAGIQQYEISNFARTGFESQHNLKYWTRQSYLGFGVDAHSMIFSSAEEFQVRFSNPDSLERYVAGTSGQRDRISYSHALQEAFFLGLRLNRGVDLAMIAAEFGQATIENYFEIIADLAKQGLIAQQGNTVRLTAPGRLLSNEVFEQFISVEALTASA